MNGLSRFVVTRKKTIVGIFIAAAVFFAVMAMGVNINYNLTEYLPEDAQSTQALHILEDEFGAGIPNASVMVEDVSISEGLEYKEKLLSVDGVSDVMWLDDVMDITQPVETADAALVEGYYKDGAALFSVTVETGKEKQAMTAIYDIIGEKGSALGDAVNNYALQNATTDETTTAMLILVPIILGILFLTTASFIEPFLFVVTIGCSIIINMGMNAFSGEISFVTMSVSPILQLAVSLDYAIFLLHSFDMYRRETDNTAEAMVKAMKKAFPAIAASAATTIFGFLALMFMRFGIGSDMGLNLVKGIALSFASVMLLLPALALLCCKLIDRTKHRSLFPSLKKAGRGVLKIRYIAIAAAFILIVPCFLAQNNNSYLYGAGTVVAEGSRIAEDEEKIEDSFGESMPIVLLVPRGDADSELLLSQKLEKLDHVSQVVGYANTVGTAIPPEYVGEEIAGQFYSDNYARIIVYTDTEAEGDIAFETVEAVQGLTAEYYGDTAYSCGESVNLYDMRNIITFDSFIVNMIAIAAIAGVLIVTFKSAVLPAILLFAIEASIWMNLSIPYFMGTYLSYMGYLIISTAQLGATVDYAILFGTHYVAERRIAPKRQAITSALGESMESILISGSILAIAGLSLFLVSSNEIVATLGMLVFRGTLMSVAMVLLFQPAMLYVCDKGIEKTTYKAGFFHEAKKKH